MNNEQVRVEPVAWRVWNGRWCYLDGPREPEGPWELKEALHTAPPIKQEGQP